MRTGDFLSLGAILFFGSLSMMLLIQIRDAVQRKSGDFEFALFATIVALVGAALFLTGIIKLLTS